MAVDLLEALRAARLHQQRQGGDLDSLVRRSMGLHSTDYASPYLSAWARISGFDAAEMFSRLNRGRGLVRVNCMRSTVHVVHVDDLPLIFAATGEGVASAGRRFPPLRALSDGEIHRGVERIQGALAEGPLGTNELKARLPDLAEHMRSWLLITLGGGQVIRADAAHARSNRTRYALTRSWVDGFKHSDLPAAEARRLLIGRAVEAFGPVSEADLAWWLPAPKGEVVRALASYGKNVRSLEQQGRRFWYAPELADLAAPPREEQGAWLLPYEDGLLKGYLDRSWCLAPGLREVLFPFNASHWFPPDGVDPGPGPHKGVNVTGEARPSVWWGGRVVGRWEEAGEGVVWQVHSAVGAEGQARIAAEITRLERFLRTQLRPIS